MRDACRRLRCVIVVCCVVLVIMCGSSSPRCHRCLLCFVGVRCVLVVVSWLSLFVVVRNMLFVVCSLL